MEDRQQYILKLEEDANRLVEGIGTLKKEVSSYKTATEELDKARASVAAFLGKTEDLTRQTHKLLSTMNEIGSADIFRRLEEIKRRSTTWAVVLAVGLVIAIVLEVVLLKRLHP